MSAVYYQVIVSYDLEDTKVRNRLRKDLMGIGLVPVQKSVMWGYLSVPEERAAIEILRMTPRNGVCDSLFLSRSNLESAMDVSVFGIGHELLEHPDDDRII